MPPRAIANEARERMLEAKRRLGAAERGSPGWEQAYIDVELATEAYEDAFEAARGEHRPEPPPSGHSSDATKTDMNAEGDDGQVYGG